MWNKVLFKRSAKIEKQLPLLATVTILLKSNGTKCNILRKLFKLAGAICGDQLDLGDKFMNLCWRSQPIHLAAEYQNIESS